MNGKDVLLGLSHIDRKFIDEAETSVLSGSQKITPLRKSLVIAAVIAMMLLLVGCAVVYVLRLQDMAFGKKVQEYYDGSSQEVTLLSLQGIQGTPGYQATKEWYEWLESYDADMTVYHSEEAFSEDFGEDYYAYILYSREMKDKLDEICGTYDLELLGKMYVDPDIEAGCRALGIHGIFRPGVQAEADWGNILYYANGSFDLEGYVKLPGMDAHIVSFRCHRKNTFTELYGSIGPEDTCETWNYTTSNGVDVLMVLDYGGVRGNAMMFVDRGEYVFLFSVHEFDDMPLPDKAQMEAYSEAFDFTVQPQRVTEEDLVQAEERREEADKQSAEKLDRQMRSFSELGYEDRVKFQLEHAVNPELLSFAVLDLESNGTQDLLVGENGYIRAVYTTVDGGTQHMMPFSLVYLNALHFGTDVAVGEILPANWSYIYLCENNALAYVYDLTGDGVAYHFASVKNGELVWTDRIVYDPVNHADAPWQKHDETHNSNPITEVEFNRIVDSYHRAPLDMYPISDYPLNDDSPSGIGNPPTTYESYADLIRRRTELDRDSSYYYYQLLDFDGDGQQELIWKEGSWIGIFTMQDGQVKQLVSGPDVKLCEGNVLAVTRTYLDGNKTFCYYKIENGNAVLMDYLRYDTDRNSEAPWFSSSDRTGQDMTLKPVSADEAMFIMDSYKLLDYNMKPFNEFPFR